MRRPSRPRTVFLATSVVAVSAVGCGGLGNRVDGTLVEVQDTGDPDTARVIVELDEGDLIGSTDVELTFDLDVLRCLDGGQAGPDDLRPGIEVRAQRSDTGSIDSMDPPPVRGTDVAIRCGD